jgi:hypothetical protein
MRKGVRGKLEMAARVRQFSRAHPSEDPGYATVLGRFEERLTRAEAIVARQYNGLTSAAGHPDHQPRVPHRGAGDAHPGRGA